jgi:CheY-like chemotaxis protein
MTAKVLIVEDEPLFLTLAAELVEEAGMEPVTASNADDAIVLLEQDSKTTAEC